MTVQSAHITPSRRGVPDELLTCATEDDEQRMLRRKMRVYPTACLTATNRAGTSSPNNKTKRKAAGV
jgi:hypothetical protein